MEASSKDTDKKESSVCEECCLNPSKYRCPGCSIRSCSLECVKGHKQRTSCTGKRPRTQFVPLSQFNDDIIISDYNLLEEAKRAAESAQRMRDGLCNSYFKLPYKLRIFKSAANHRKIRLLFLSNGMMKRQKNQSRYDKRLSVERYHQLVPDAPVVCILSTHSVDTIHRMISLTFATGKNSIFWTIEWQFHSTELVLTDNGVDENSSLSEVVEKHLKLGPWNNQLRPFCEEQLDSLNFFIRTNPKGIKSPFRELDIKAPISQQLAGITILEYPVIHVFLPSASHDFEVVKYANPFTEKSGNSDSANIMSPSQKGVLFKEEEVLEEEEEEKEEDGFSIDPQILDLMKYENSEPLRNVQTPNLMKPVLKSCSLQTEDNKASSSNAKELRNVSSDLALLGEADPDEFLDPEFVEEGSMNEELEEGEILPPRF